MGVQGAHDPRRSGYYLNYGFDRIRLVAPVRTGAPGPWLLQAARPQSRRARAADHHVRLHGRDRRRIAPGAGRLSGLPFGFRPTRERRRSRSMLERAPPPQRARLGRLRRRLVRYRRRSPRCRPSSCSTSAPRSWRCLAAWATVIVFVPKLWSMLWDPWVGAWSDRTITRIGRRRPFMIVGSLGMPLAFVAMFSPPSLDTFATGVWVGVTYFLLATLYSLFAVPYVAIPAELDRRQRSARPPDLLADVRCHARHPHRRGTGSVVGDVPWRWARRVRIDVSRRCHRMRIGHDGTDLDVTRPRCPSLPAFLRGATRRKHGAFWRSSARSCISSTGPRVSAAIVRERRRHFRRPVSRDAFLRSQRERHRHRIVRHAHRDDSNSDVVGSARASAAASYGCCKWLWSLMHSRALAIGALSLLHAPWFSSAAWVRAARHSVWSDAGTALHAGRHVDPRKQHAKSFRGRHVDGSMDCDRKARPGSRPNDHGLGIVACRACWQCRFARSNDHGIRACSWPARSRRFAPCAEPSR